MHRIKCIKVVVKHLQKYLARSSCLRTTPPGKYFRHSYFTAQALWQQPHRFAETSLRSQSVLRYIWQLALLLLSRLPLAHSTAACAKHEQREATEISFLGAVHGSSNEETYSTEMSAGHMSPPMLPERLLFLIGFELICKTVLT